METMLRARDMSIPVENLWKEILSTFISSVKFVISGAKSVASSTRQMVTLLVDPT